MHAETLAYMLHQLPLDRKLRVAVPAIRAARPVTPQMMDIPAGAVTMGLERGSQSFGWDNEYEAHPAHVPAFSIDQFKVTNQQYLEFVHAGGYDAPSLWTADDWSWKIGHNILHPIFWTPVGDGWLYRTMFVNVTMRRSSRLVTCVPSPLHNASALVATVSLCFVAWSAEGAQARQVLLKLRTPAAITAHAHRRCAGALRLLCAIPEQAPII